MAGFATCIGTQYLLAMYVIDLPTCIYQQCNCVNIYTVNNIKANNYVQ